jgi:large exoprotein involved in heme utilization and adhesion
MGTQGWRVAMAIGLGMSGAIGLSIPPAVAQSVIVPDNTLGNERSQIEFRSIGERITGGAVRGVNLFHSFLEFNVGDGRSTYFIAPNSSIENILARVTGKNPSEILGTLGTAQLVNGRLQVSNANLFLINPNGIVFGSNADLDVDRSLLITTASGIQFGDQGAFSATNPSVPSAVLTINPSAFLFEAIANQKLPEIVVRSNAPSQPGSRILGLRVPNGETLLLLGGNVAVDSGQLKAFGGRVEIGAVSSAGTVGLSPEGQLSLPEGMVRATVEFTQGAQVNVSLGNGSIGVYAQDIRVLGESQLLAGIFSGLGTSASRAGDLTLEATGDIRVANNSLVANHINKDATGQQGERILSS